MLHIYVPQVVKNRLQLQGELLARGQYVKTYRGPLHGLMIMAKTDGLASLQAGLGPAMLYQVHTWESRINSLTFV